MHFDLDQCCRGSGTDINEQRDQRRAWQRRLNDDIQRLALELIVNLFRCCATINWFYSIDYYIYVFVSIQQRCYLSSQLRASSFSQ